MPPAVAPWVSGRVGFESLMEAGLTYTGRSVRLDGRHAFEWGRVALSAGLGASAVLSGPTGDKTAGTPARPEGSTYFEVAHPRGFGADLPLLIGWQDSSQIVTVWTGPRGGFERLTAEVSLTLPSPARRGDLSIGRWYWGWLVGFAVGFRHVHGAIELCAYQQAVHGNVLGTDVSVTGITVAPAAALLATF